MDDKEKKKASDVFRQVLSSGISAALGAEDTVKGLLHDLPLPKEMINGLLDNAKNAKTEFIGSVKTELRDYLNKVNVSKEIDRVLENYEIEVEAKLKFHPKKKRKSTVKNNQK